MLIQKINKIINYIASYYQNVIGISIYNGTVYVAEIKKGFREIKVIRTDQYEFKSNNYEDIINNVKNDFELKDKLISVNLYNSSASYKLLKIPKIPENEIEPWLKDNSNEFLPTSISFEDIEFNYKIVSINDEIIILLGFVKNEEIEHLLDAFGTSENTIARITPGLIDLPLMNTKKENSFDCIYITNENYHELVLYQSGELIYYNQVPPAFQKGSDVDNIQGLFGKELELLEFEPDEKNIQILIAGQTPQKNNNKYPVNDKFLPSYLSALSIINGKEDSINFLPKPLKSEILTLDWKQAILKFSIVVGIFIFALYFIAFISVFLLGESYDSVEKEREALAPNLIRIYELQSQKNLLKHDLSDAGQVQTYKSHSSILLEALAFHIPKNCWLTEINYNQESEKSLNTVIKGMSKNKTVINNFLANLEGDKNFKKLKLDFINKVTRDEMFRDWKIKSSKYLEFQISVEF